LSILEVKKATFAYENSENVFEGVNLTVDEGDVVCILGSNGCGKTTLIKCLNRLHKLKEGAVYINGEDIKTIDQRTIARNIGYIPQGHVSTFAFTVFDVVLMGRTPHIDYLDSPGTEDHRITEEALKKFGISHLKNKPYTSLSGGEQQLVFFARVIAQEPRILLLDEPTSHLDFGNQLKTLNIISKLSKEGISIVMTSHYPDHAFISANKVALMKDKNFLGIDCPENIITKENMENIYGINVEIMDINKDRKICVPILPNESK
jgi:iron complex transport system ATP-binding protein